MTAQRTPARPTVSETATVARGSAVNAIAMALGAVLGFGLTVLVSRWLQPKNAGALFELIAMFTILSNTLELGADTGLTRWISRARAIGGLGRVRQVLAVALVPVLVIGCAAAVAMWFAAPGLASIFLHSMPAGVAVRDIRIVAPLVPIGALSNCVLAGPRGYDRMWPYLAIEGVGKPLARLVLVLVALILGWGLQGALVAWCIPIAVGLVAAWLILMRLVRSEPDRGHRGGRSHLMRPAGSLLPPRRPDLAPAARSQPGRHQAATGDLPKRQRLGMEFWSFAGPRGFAGAFQIVVIWLDILLVGALVSRYAAGVYSAVSKLALVGTYALAAQRLAIGPQLSALLARKKMDRAANLFHSATVLLMVATWPLYLFLAIFPGVVLGIFGPRYTSGSVALTILSLAMLVNLGTGNVTVVLLMGGKSSYNAYNALASLSVNVALNLILLPRMGISGAAIAWAASIVVDNTAAAIEVHYQLGLSTIGPGYWFVVMASVGCFGVAGLSARLIIGQTLVALLASGAVGLAAYAFLIYRARARLQINDFYGALRRRGAGAERRDDRQPT
jgi:O-antigen/teichoic acid export membrane protein